MLLWKHQSLLLTASPAQGHRSCVLSELSHGWRRSFTVDELPVHYRSNTERQTTADRGGNPTHVTQQGRHRTRLYNQYKIHHKNKRSMWKQAARFAVLLNCKQQVEHRKCFPPEEAARRALTVVHETNTSFLSQFSIRLRRERSLRCFSELMARACSFWKKKPFHTLTSSCLDAACFGSPSAAISKLICFFAQCGFCSRDVHGRFFYFLSYSGKLTLN